MARVMVVMDGQTVDYSLIVNLLKSGFDVSWAFNPAMAGLLAQASPPDAYVLDVRSGPRPVDQVCGELREELGVAELPTIALTCAQGGAGLEVKFDMRQGGGDGDRLTTRQLADVARACAAAVVGVFVTSLGRGLAAQSAAPA